MNTKFADATTGMAFALTLSKRQCNSLLRLRLLLKKGNTTEATYERLWIISVDGLNGLLRKGLVYWKQDKNGKPESFGGLTRAGELVAELLIEAGLSVDATNTPLVARRLERFEEDKVRRGR